MTDYDWLHAIVRTTKPRNEIPAQSEGWVMKVLDEGVLEIVFCYDGFFGSNRHFRRVLLKEAQSFLRIVGNSGYDPFTTVGGLQALGDSRAP